MKNAQEKPHNHWYFKFKAAQEKVQQHGIMTDAEEMKMIREETGFDYPNETIAQWKNKKEEWESLLLVKDPTMVMRYNDKAKYSKNPYFRVHSEQNEYLFAKLLCLWMELKITIVEGLPSEGFFGILSYTVPKASREEFNSTWFPTLVSTKVKPSSKESNKIRKTLQAAYKRMNLKEFVDFTTGNITGVFQRVAVVEKSAVGKVTPLLVLGVMPPVAVGGMSPVAMGCMPPVAVGVMPPVAVGVMPPVAVGVMPPVALGVMPPVAVGVMPPVAVGVMPSVAVVGEKRKEVDPLAMLAEVCSVAKKRGATTQE